MIDKKDVMSMPGKELKIGEYQSNFKEDVDQSNKEIDQLVAEDDMVLAFLVADVESSIIGGTEKSNETGLGQISKILKKSSNPNANSVNGNSDDSEGNGSGNGSSTSTATGGISSDNNTNNLSSNS